MTLAVTAMVRDEADIIRRWVDYHVAQGVDVIIVTDNASTDGTTEILAEFEAAGTIVLHHDPEHRKQQGAVVTRMAREAATVHGADWVVNADADEFLIPRDRSLRLADVFARLDAGLGSFSVPVVNMVGPVALDGPGIDRLVWRDERTNDELRAVGVLAQPTTNAVHVADADVTVAQGNHVVSIASTGAPAQGLELEVLHLPWRSWTQFRRKVESAGLGYLASPHLTPSPNHHGMRDYRRLLDGTLLSYYAARHVTDAEAAEGPFRLDRSLVEFLAEVPPSGPYPPDVPFTEPVDRHLGGLGRSLVGRDEQISRQEARLDQAAQALSDAEDEAVRLRRHAAGLEDELARTRAEVEAMRNRRIVKLVDGVRERTRRTR